MNPDENNHVSEAPEPIFTFVSPESLARKRGIRFPKFHKNIKVFMSIIALSSLLLISLGIVVVSKKTTASQAEKKHSSVSIPQKNLTPSPTMTQNTTINNKTIISAPSATPKIMVTVTPKPTVTKVQPTTQVVKPAMQISYPSENQSITMNTSQTFCMVDVPVSNTQGLQKRKNINKQGWTTYATPDTTCFDPKEGKNTVQFQYKNNVGGESDIYTVNFNFHREQNITISVSGSMYRDTNCNGTKDSGESEITDGNTTASLYKMPEFSLYSSTNTSGNYTLSKSIGENESVTVQLDIVAPSGYKINITSPSFTLSKNNTSSSFDWPMVPGENIGACQ